MKKIITIITPGWTFATVMQSELSSRLNREIKQTLTNDEWRVSMRASTSEVGAIKRAIYDVVDQWRELVCNYKITVEDFEINDDE